MILILKGNQMFLKCFNGNTNAIKIFSCSLHIALILDPGNEFFYAKCVQFPLTFIE